MNVLQSEKFLSGNVDTYLIDENPQLFKFQPSQNRAQKLLHYLGNVMVNGSMTPLSTTLKPAKMTPALPPITAGQCKYCCRRLHSSFFFTKLVVLTQPVQWLEDKRQYNVNNYR